MKCLVIIAVQVENLVSVCHVEPDSGCACQCFTVDQVSKSECRFRDEAVMQSAVSTRDSYHFLCTMCMQFTFQRSLTYK